VTWGRRRRAQNTELSVYFLKPHDHTRETFGFEQELLLAYSPYPVLEPRAIQAAEQILYDDPARGRVERLILQPRVEEKFAAQLAADLDGKKPGEVSELWFTLQQRVLDELFAAIQIETARLS
jgi:hypothetical protein